MSGERLRMGIYVNKKFKLSSEGYFNSNKNMRLLVSETNSHQFKFVKQFLCGFSFRAPSLVDNGSSMRAKVPKLELRKETMFVVPEVDVKSLTVAVDANDDDVNSVDKNVLWTINYDRFHREFRDQVNEISVNNAKAKLYNLTSLGPLRYQSIVIKGL